jgi:hypothetical protein
MLMNSGCDNVINRNNSAIAGILSPLGDASCQTSCRGNIYEACGSLDTFISIYEFNVSGFLRNACVQVLFLLCSFLLGGGMERSSVRRRRELLGSRLKGWRCTTRRSRGGGAGEALMSGPRPLTYRPTSSVREVDSRSMQFFQTRLRVAHMTITHTRHISAPMMYVTVYLQESASPLHGLTSSTTDARLLFVLRLLRSRVIKASLVTPVSSILICMSAHVDYVLDS